MRTLWTLIILFAMPEAFALEESTRENLIRFEQKLRESIEDHTLDKSQLSPLTIVDVRTTEEDPKVLQNTLISHLNQALRAPVMICDACQAIYSSDSQETVYNSGVVDIHDIRRIYAEEKLRPKAAVWISLDRTTLSVRIVSLETSQVLFADTIDPRMDWSARSMQSFSQSRRAERMARGDPILHGHWDVGLNPFTGSSAHIGYSYLQQWGENNEYLSGLCFNLSDPVLGFGFAGFRAFSEIKNSLVGVKLLVNTPQALARSTSNGENTDSSSGSLYNIVIMAKYPVGEGGKFFANAFVGTSGSFGIGLSW